MQGKQPWIEQAVGVHASSQGEQTLPVLVRAALAHVQFETIHPFLDGNGRLGRLLIVLMLIDAEVLRQPLLYLSLFLQHRSRCYGLLDGVRQHGDRSDPDRLLSRRRREHGHRCGEDGQSTARSVPRR